MADRERACYQIYKPVPRDFVAVKLRIGESENIPRGISRYYLDVRVSPSKYSIEGENGLKTESIWTLPLCSMNWNEDLIFHVEKEHFNKETIKFDLKLNKNKYGWPTLIDTESFILSKIGTNSGATIEFQDRKLHQVYKVNVSLSIERTPKLDVHIRNQDSLCEQETRFCAERRPKIQKSIQHMEIKWSSDLQNDHVPTIAVIGSGGGMRAVVGMCGAMDALNDMGILNCAMYIAGLSGSSWYVSTLYALNGSTKVELNTAEMKQSVKDSLQKVPTGEKEMFSSWGKALKRDVLYGKSLTMTNAYGNIIGDILLGQNFFSKWSDQRKRLEDGGAPLPLLAALHVNDESLQDFNEWIEFSPYEVFMPNCGSGIDMKQFGSEFKSGFLTHQYDEPSIHYLQGICGSFYGDAKCTETSDSTEKFSYVKKLACNFIKLVEGKVLGNVPNWLYDMAKFERLGGDNFKNEMIHVMPKKEDMLLTDAGIIFNSPYPLVLHPARKVDLIISFELSDLSEQGPLTELEKAEKWANERNIPFPSLEENNNEGKNGMFVFASKDAPTIIHFVLNANNDKPDFITKPFCEFSTNRFQYSHKDFEKLSKHMSSRVVQNKAVIKEEIEKAIIRQKKKRVIAI